MKQILFIASAIVFLVSCKKDPVNKIIPVYTVSYDSMAVDLQPGRNINFFEMDGGKFGLLVPINAIDQRYELRYVDTFITREFTLSLSAPDGNANFSTATYTYPTTDTFGKTPVFAARNVIHYQENSPTGLAALGEKIDTTVISIPTGNNASITYPAQSVVYSQKIYAAKYPITYGTQWSGSNISSIYNFFINIPDSNINAAGEERHTISYNSMVTTSGLMNVQTRPFAKEGATVPVLIIKQVVTDKRDFYINGSLAPSGILSLAGLEQGKTTTTTSFNYFSPIAGRGYIGTVYLNSSGTGMGRAIFKKFF